MTIMHYRILLLSESITIELDSLTQHLIHYYVIQCISNLHEGHIRGIQCIYKIYNVHEGHTYDNEVVLVSIM